MKHFILFFHLSLTVFALNAIDFEEESRLMQYWEAEAIYLKLDDKKSLMNYSGEIYSYDNQKCFRLVHNRQNPKPLQASPKKCSKTLLKKANFPYAQIKNYDLYQQRLIQCLAKRKKKCLKGLISKTLKTSDSIEPMGDRRELAFRNWKKKDIRELITLIKQGTQRDGNYRHFPKGKKPVGTFTRTLTPSGGYWLLTKYIRKKD